jgi:hypothetical protein
LLIDSCSLYWVAQHRKGCLREREGCSITAMIGMRRFRAAPKRCTYLGVTRRPFDAQVFVGIIHVYHHEDAVPDLLTV